MTSHPARSLQPTAAKPAAGGLRAGVEIGGGLLIALAVLVAFWPSLGGGFLWDDENWIAATPTTPTHRLIHDPDGLFRIWFRSDAEDYWPLSTSMFWLEWRWWGMNPTGYRLVNLGLHALGAILVWRVLRTLRVPGGWLGGLVFAVHPVTVASVAWIAELKNCLSLPLHATALLCWLWFDETGRRRWYAAALVAFALALAAKTSTVILPVLLLACCWWRRGRITREDITRTVPFFFLSLAMGSITLWLQAPHGAVAGEPPPDGFLTRLAASGWVVWFYLTKAVVPLRLAMLYPRWHVDPATPVAWLPLAALGAAAIVVRRLDPRWSRPLTMALGWYVVSLGPVLGIINMWFRRYALASDHLQYLALPAITALVTAGLASAARNPRWRPVAGVAATALVLTLGMLTWQRSAVFRSTIALMEDSLAKNPDSWTARTNLGAALVTVGRTPEAIAHYREALQLLPTSAEAHNNLGNALFQLGRPQEAIPHYQESLRIKPGVAGVHSNLGIALVLVGNLPDAAPHFEAAVRLDPANQAAQDNLRRCRELLQGPAPSTP